MMYAYDRLMKGVSPQRQDTTRSDALDRLSSKSTRTSRSIYHEEDLVVGDIWNRALLTATDNRGGRGLVPTRVGTSKNMAMVLRSNKALTRRTNQAMVQWRSPEKPRIEPKIKEPAEFRRLRDILKGGKSLRKKGKFVNGVWEEPLTKGRLRAVGDMASGMAGMVGGWGGLGPMYSTASGLPNTMLRGVKHAGDFLFGGAKLKVGNYNQDPMAVIKEATSRLSNASEKMPGILRKMGNGIGLSLYEMGVTQKSYVAAAASMGLGAVGIGMGAAGGTVVSAAAISKSIGDLASSSTAYRGLDELIFRSDVRKKFRARGEEMGVLARSQSYGKMQEMFPNLRPKVTSRSLAVTNGRVSTGNSITHISANVSTTGGIGNELSPTRRYDRIKNKLIGSSDNQMVRWSRTNNKLLPHRVEKQVFPVDRKLLSGKTSQVVYERGRSVLRTNEWWVPSMQNETVAELDNGHITNSGRELLDASKRQEIIPIEEKPIVKYGKNEVVEYNGANRSLVVQAGSRGVVNSGIEKKTATTVEEILTSTGKKRSYKDLTEIRSALTYNPNQMREGFFNNLSYILGSGFRPLTHGTSFFSSAEKKGVLGELSKAEIREMGSYRVKMGAAFLNLKKGAKMTFTQGFKRAGYEPEPTIRELLTYSRIKRDIVNANKKGASTAEIRELENVLDNVAGGAIKGPGAALMQGAMPLLNLAFLPTLLKTEEGEDTFRTSGSVVAFEASFMLFGMAPMKLGAALGKFGGEIAGNTFGHGMYAGMRGLGKVGRGIGWGLGKAGGMAGLEVGSKTAAAASFIGKGARAASYGARIALTEGAGAIGGAALGLAGGILGMIAPDIPFIYMDIARSVAKDEEMRKEYNAFIGDKPNYDLVLAGNSSVLATERERASAFARQAGMDFRSAMGDEARLYHG